MSAEAPVVYTCFPEPMGNTTTESLTSEDSARTNIEKLAGGAISKLAGCVAIGGTAYYAEIGVMRFDIKDDAGLTTSRKEIVAAVAFNSPYDPRSDDFPAIEGSGPIIRENFTDRCKPDVIQVDDLPEDQVQKAFEAIAVKYAALQNRPPEIERAQSTGDELAPQVSAAQTIGQLNIGVTKGQARAAFDNDSWTPWSDSDEMATSTASGRLYPATDNDSAYFDAQLTRICYDPTDPQGKTETRITLDTRNLHIAQVADAEPVTVPVEHGSVVEMDVLSPDGRLSVDDTEIAAAVLYNMARANAEQARHITS